MKDGLILIDKPEGITSFVAVAVVRRALGVKRCGHTGTLDPLATGLLPVLTGTATKLSSFLLEGDKQYEAELSFGTATDTYDITGKVTQEGGRIPDEQELRDILNRFTGKQMQRPPMFSALKKEGVALYKLARQGVELDLPEREIEIYDLKLKDYADGKATLWVHCSKGTYIRSLCSDIAQALGTYGCMSALRRTATCGFSVDDAVKLERAEEMLKAGDTSSVIPIGEILDLPRYTPPAFFARLLKNGCAVETRKLAHLPLERAWVYDGEELLGIGEIQDDTFKIIVHL